MKQYHDLLKAILERGSYKEPAREGMPGTRSLFGHQSRYNLQEGFPILTTKKVNFQHIIVELLWFLRGDTNIKFLLDNRCNIWNQDAFNYYQKILKQHNIKDEGYKFEEFIEAVKEQNTPAIVGIDESVYRLGDCGFQYGRVWRSWEKAEIEEGELIGVKYIDQLGKVINNIRTKPYDRRKVVSAIDPTRDEDLALYWCHSLFQFNCRAREFKDIWHDCEELYDTKAGYPGAMAEDIKDRGELVEEAVELGVPVYLLDCQMYQRSADMFLGVPYNISSYALLTHIIAKMCNMVPGEFIHTFGDAHIYDNHRDQVNEILTRDPEKYKLPTLKIDWDEAYIKNMKQDIRWMGFMRVEDFQLEGYESYPAIKAELSTGMKQDRP